MKLRRALYAAIQFNRSEFMEWHVVERHGLWWAYKGEHPPDEAFKTHGRPTSSPIVGPFASRVAAELILPRRLDRFGRPTPR